MNNLEFSYTCTVIKALKAIEVLRRKKYGIVN
jgi:hypothetical protein